MPNQPAIIPDRPIVRDSKRLGHAFERAAKRGRIAGPGLPVGLAPAVAEAAAALGRIRVDCAVVKLAVQWAALPQRAAVMAKVEHLRGTAGRTLCLLTQGPADLKIAPEIVNHVLWRRTPLEAEK
jgi:hypothetical protein